MQDLSAADQNLAGTLVPCAHGDRDDDQVGHEGED